MYVCSSRSSGRAVFSVLALRINDVAFSPCFEFSFLC
jgi:hypothetical protein